MNSFQAMHFVDTASPQQLKAMVDSQNPYSFMALAKLQQIRDAAMRQKAHEPVPPPLSQQIPQEIAKAEAPAVPQTPVGIAALAPQMPQQPQAGIGREMTAAAAGGGLVAFAGGGQTKINPETGEPYTSYGQSTDIRSLNYPSLLDRLFNPRAMDTYNEMYSRRRGQTKRPELAAQNAGQEVAPYTSLVAEPSAISESGDRYTPLPLAGEPTAADVAATSGIGNQRESAPAATPNLNPIPVSSRSTGSAAPSAGGIASLGFTPGIQARAALDAAGERLNRLEGLRGNTPERVAAMGDLEAERKARLQALREEMPDRLAPYEKELKDEREKLGKGNEDIKNQALLNVALGLLNPKGTGGQGLGGLLSAVGEAGKSGLSEFNKLKAIQDERAEKLRGLEMNLAVQREARDRGQFDMAQRAAESERNLRMDLYKSDNALAAQTVMANVQLELHRADMPYKDADLKLKQISAQLQAMQSNRPQEWEQKVMLANAIGQRTNQDPGKILSQMVLGSVEGRQEERAASVAANAIKDMPNFTPEDQAAKRAAFNEMYNAIMSGMTGGLSYDPKTKSLTGGK